MKVAIVKAGVVIDQKLVVSYTNLALTVTLNSHIINKHIFCTDRTEADNTNQNKMPMYNYGIYEEYRSKAGINSVLIFY